MKSTGKLQKPSIFNTKGKNLCTNPIPKTFQEKKSSYIPALPLNILSKTYCSMITIKYFNRNVKYLSNPKVQLNSRNPVSPIVKATYMNTSPCFYM